MSYPDTCGAPYQTSANCTFVLERLTAFCIPSPPRLGLELELSITHYGCLRERANSRASTFHGKETSRSPGCCAVVCRYR